MLRRICEELTYLNGEKFVKKIWNGKESLKKLRPILGCNTNRKEVNYNYVYIQLTYSQDNYYLNTFTKKI